MAKSKQVRRREQPPSSKTPTTAENPDFGQTHPSWQIRLLQTQGPFGWDVLDNEKLERIRKRLANFETMTWNEILVKDKKRNHTIQVADLPGENQKLLRKIGEQDVDQLVSLSVSSRERIFGILEKGILRLLWWDPEHRVYPSAKKHT